MNIDGSNPRPVFNDLAIQAAEPMWTADGNYIIVRRSGGGGGGEGGGGGGGLYMYHKSGGVGVSIVTDGRPEFPSTSSDGKCLYYQVSVTQGIVSGKNDVTQGSRQLRRVELATGHVLMITEGVSEQQYQGSSGGAVAPMVSPDGRWLAFGRRIPNGTI